MSKLMWLGTASLASGVASGALERVFYGARLDENNVLQESFFLPLAFILSFLGVGLIATATCRYWIRKIRSRGN